MGYELGDESYCRWLSRHFFANGYDAEDLAQEARLAMHLADAPRFKRRAARLRILDIVKMSNRQPVFAAELDYRDAAPGSLVDLVIAREQLRGYLDADLSDLERAALGGMLRGEPLGRAERSLDNARYRVRRKLAA